MVKSVLQKVLLAPHLWFGVAALSIAGSFVIDYIDAQRTADRALALRQGPPPAVAIQDFNPSAHVGPAREVRVRAETSMGEPVVVTLGPEGAERAAVIFPLFPLSDQGSEAVRIALESDGSPGSIRPVRRPNGGGEPPKVLGVILHMSDAPRGAEVDTRSLIARSFGRGAYGTVIEINGERVVPGEMGLVVKGAMAAIGYAIPDGFLAVAPYVGGRREALAPPPASGLQSGLFWGGLALALVAVLLSVRAFESNRAPAAVPREPGQQDTRAPTGRTVKARTRFRSIPTQDELYATAQSEQARLAEPTATKKLIDGARTGVERIRTRR